MSVPYRQIDDLDSLVIDLLEFVRTLPFIVDLVLFDRGFYHTHLIDYLENKKGGNPWSYLMLVPRTDKVKEYIKLTESFGVFNHKFKYAKEKSTWKPSTTIMVKRVDEETCWCYATNQKPCLQPSLEYRKHGILRLALGFMMMQG